MSVTTFVRTLLYAIATVTAIATLGLAAAFVNESHKRFPGHYDVSDYNDTSAELLAAAIIFILTLAPLHFIIHLGSNRPRGVASLGVEAAILFINWALFFGGAVALTSYLGDPFPYVAGRQPGLHALAKALVVFAWFTWGLLNGLLFMVVAIGLQGRIWDHPFADVCHGTCDRENHNVVGSTPGDTSADSKEMSRV
ncbi:hypothetical protein JCM3766R1_006446 [Sporobolomyces carnicolor]